MSLKLFIWLCSIHFEATGGATSQSSAYVGHDVARWRLANYCLNMSVNQFDTMIVWTLTEKFATKDYWYQG
jgi:hypothetical protein